MAFASVVETLVEKFGWPGMLGVFVMFMIVHYATDEQRHALIDMYLLGRGIGAVYPIIFMGALFSGVVLAQRYSFRKKEKIMQEELTRLGAEKSARQEQAIGAPLHHAPAAQGKR